MVRGINRQEIFFDNEDRAKYLQSLDKARARSKCAIYAYCLMDNHLHLVMSEGEEEIGQVMKRLGSSYVHWYNRKYARVGHLFQDRFRSEVVNDERYLLAAVRYVHQNPIKAGMASHCSSYQWSSYNAYLNKGDNPNLVNTALVMGIAGGIKSFIGVHLELVEEDMLEIEKVERAADTVVSEQIKSILQGVSPTELLAMDETKRRDLCRQLKALPGISQRQIARLTGLNRNVIQRA